MVEAFAIVTPPLQCKQCVTIDHIEGVRAYEWQIVIDLAGGISETTFRGENRKRGFLVRRLQLPCGDDLKNAAAVLADLEPTYRTGI
jgi:hypothetical protein